MVRKYVATTFKSIIPLITVPQQYYQNIPYFAQWESPELVDKIIHREMQAHDDPAWRASGAMTQEEYALWSWNGCGLACTKMMLAHARDTHIPLADLGKHALTYGVYKEPLAASPGLYYKPYVHFLKQEFGLKARASSTLVLPQIIRALSKNRYVMTSVAPGIRHPHQTSRRKEGHLVLIVGYDLTKKELYIHNPSGFPGHSQVATPISFSNFVRFFDGKGIITAI